jgi:carboxyl-terminal processing protease
MLRGEDIKRFTITRRPVVPQSVKLRRQDGFAIVRLTSFNKGTTKALRQAIRQDSRQNGKPLGLILDLRGNRGGLLNQAIDVSDLFLGSGKILITDGRNFRAKQRFTAEDAELAYGVPMAVLIDQRSASATEVLAAALQDNKRALLIGSRTFGKGTVQTVIRLPDGGEMTVTWARMFAPSGYALSTYGVFPDICIINLASDNAGNPSAVRSASDEAMQLLDQRRNSANLSEAKQQALLASCGPKTLSTANGDEALSIAKTILGNPSIANIPTQ